MNFLKTSREVGLSHTTINNYYNKFWDKSLDSRIGIADKAALVEAKKLKDVSYQSGPIKLINNIFEHAVGRAIEILTDEELKKTLPARDLVQLINVLIPYVAEKKSIIGVK